MLTWCLAARATFLRTVSAHTKSTPDSCSLCMCAAQGKHTHAQGFTRTGRNTHIQSFTCTHLFIRLKECVQVFWEREREICIIARNAILDTSLSLLSLDLNHMKQFKIRTRSEKLVVCSHIRAFIFFFKHTRLRQFLFPYQRIQTLQHITHFSAESRLQRKKERKKSGNISDNTF